MNVMIFVEEEHLDLGHLLAQLGEECVGHLVEVGALDRVTSSTLKFVFVGLVVHKDNFTLVLPKIVDSMEGGLHSRVGGLSLRSVYQYVVESRDRKQVNVLNSWKKLFEAKDVIDAYVSRNGFSVKDVFRYIRKDEKIDWSRTFARTVPMAVDGQFIYVDLIAKTLSRGESDISDLIRIAHTWLQCMEDLFHKPWDIDVQHMNAVFWDYHNIYKSDHSIGKLEWFRRRVRDDRRRLADCLLEMATECATDDVPRLFGTCNFELVWQRACNQLFSLQDTASSSAVVQPRWLVGTPATPPMPVHKLDGWRSDDSSLFICDAKYYRCRDTEVVPRIPLHDYVKQVNYASVRKEAFLPAYNLFLFPDSTVETFAVINAAVISPGATTNLDGIVFLVGVNPILALSFYCQNNSDKHYFQALTNVVTTWWDTAGIHTS